MVNFKQIVIESLLLEAYTGKFQSSTWFVQIIDNYNTAFNSNINDTTIANLFKNAKNSISTNQPDLYQHINLLNVMCYMVDTLSASKFDPDFIQEINTKHNIEEATGNEVETKDVKYTRDSWENVPHHPKIIKYLENLQTRGADALITEYGNNFVIIAVQQIVKKRIDFFTRLSKLKSPTTPFANLIYDVFRYPLEYKSGNKKFTSDFKEVDGFYIRDLIDIALAAGKFYGAEIARLKTKGTGVSSDIITAISKEAITNNSDSVANKIAFLSGQPMKYKKVDGSGKDIDPAIDLENKNYTVNAIIKLKTPEAQKLISLLSKFAEYERTKPGAGERLQYAQQAASALAGFGGAKLYG